MKILSLILWGSFILCSCGKELGIPTLEKNPTLKQNQTSPIAWEDFHLEEGQMAVFKTDLSPEKWAEVLQKSNELRQNKRWFYQNPNPDSEKANEKSKKMADLILELMNESAFVIPWTENESVIFEKSGDDLRLIFPEGAFSEVFGVPSTLWKYQKPNPIKDNDKTPYFWGKVSNSDFILHLKMRIDERVYFKDGRERIFMSAQIEVEPGSRFKSLTDEKVVYEKVYPFGFAEFTWGSRKPVQSNASGQNQNKAESP